MDKSSNEGTHDGEGLRNQQQWGDGVLCIGKKMDESHTAVYLAQRLKEVSDNFPTERRIVSVHANTVNMLLCPEMPQEKPRS